MTNIFQSIPGVIWYIVLEFLGIDILNEKKCAMLLNINHKCHNKRDFQEIWCRKHCKIITNRLLSENIYNVMNEMIGGFRIEHMSYQKILKQNEYKRLLLYRRKIKNASSINIQGFYISILNGIYNPVDADFVYNCKIPTDTVVYVKKFTNTNINDGMHLFLWKHKVDNIWYLTTRYLLPNTVPYHILIGTSYAWCKNNAKYPHEIQMYSALNKKNETEMSEFNINVVTLQYPNNISFNPIYLQNGLWNTSNIVIVKIKN